MKKLALLDLNDFEEAFSFELASYPPALYSTDGKMRPPTPATDLGNFLLKKDGSKIPSNSITTRVKIIDGNMLISDVQTVWSKGETFSQIVQKFSL